MEQAQGAIPKQGLISSRSGHSRVVWVDALKAFLALWVGYEHTIRVFGLREDESWLYMPMILILCAVPCFYFISGYFFARTLQGVMDDASNPRHAALSLLWLKFRQLIVPGVVFLLLTEWWFVYGLIRLDFALNYFVLSLFVAMCIIVAVVLCWRYSTRVCKFVFVGIAICAALTLGAFASRGWTFLNFNLTMHGIIFVLAGYLMASFPKDIVSKILRPMPIVMALTFYVLVYVYLPALALDGAIKSMVLRLVMPFVGIYALVGVFYLVRGMFRLAWLAHLTAYLSRRSLALYLMLQTLMAHINFAELTGLTEGTPLNHIMVWLMLVLTTLIAHDLLCLIPGFERYVFGRQRP